MNEQTVAQKRRNSPPRGARADRKRGSYTVAEKLRAVRLHREEGFSQELVCQELGVSKSSLGLWLQQYRLGGEAALHPAQPTERSPKLPPALGRAYSATSAPSSV
jgi:transposase-like protein